jgi:hypothetical protein
VLAAARSFGNPPVRTPAAAVKSPLKMFFVSSQVKYLAGIDSQLSTDFDLGFRFLLGCERRIASNVDEKNVAEFEP